MKNFLLTSILCLGLINATSQCTPDPIYQDSTYNIWPDTVTNMPIYNTSVINSNNPYNGELLIKTPTTIIEASGGDSSLTSIDTLGQTFYVGDWACDSMKLISVDGLPNGLTLNCLDANCVLPGNTLTCASVNGVTTDPEGVYPVTIWVDVYTHGNIQFGFITIPVQTSLYEATGSYESIKGYKIIVSSTSSYEMINSNEFTLLQNMPNPSNGLTTIKFNTPYSNIVNLTITDIYGKIVHTENISSMIGLNEINLNLDLTPGMYNYSIRNDERILSKRMIISE